MAMDNNNNNNINSNNNNVQSKGNLRILAMPAKTYTNSLFPDLVNTCRRNATGTHARQML